MDWKERGKRALTKRAFAPWVILVLFAWNLIAQIDTALALPNIVSEIWDFLITPAGNLILFVLGFGWLALLIWQPPFLRRIPIVGKKVENGQQDFEELLADTASQVSTLATEVVTLKETVTPLPVVQDIEDVKRKVIIEYIAFSSKMGHIARSITFSFEITNASAICIQPTGHVRGALIFEAHTLAGVQWAVSLNPPHEIAPNEKARLDVLFPVDERLAESLAFKPRDGFFSAGFSEMEVEFEARDKNNKSQALGYVALGKQQDIKIRDEISLQNIRAFVKWRESLGEDDRITR